MAQPLGELFDACTSLKSSLKSEDSFHKRQCKIRDFIQETSSKLGSIGDFSVGLEWFNCSEPLSLGRQLRGKIVVLDFFTYCCINCLHILPHLRQLEENISVEKGVVVIGVHSAKFDNEKDSANIAAALKRYDVSHPVVNDSEGVLWSKLGISCWPTLLILGPQGRPIFQLVGEGHENELFEYVNVAVDFFSSRGELSSHSLPITSSKESILKGPLLFPGKVASIATDDGTEMIAVSNTGLHTVIIATGDGKIKHVIGCSGQPGFVDGDFKSALFNAPQGLAFFSWDSLFIADTENHAIRKVDLKKKCVLTVAGNGQQGSDETGGNIGAAQSLSSPWDLCIVRRKVPLPQSLPQPFLCICPAAPPGYKGSHVDPGHPLPPPPPPVMSATLAAGPPPPPPMLPPPGYNGSHVDPGHPLPPPPPPQMSATLAAGPPPPPPMLPPPGYNGSHVDPGHPLPPPPPPQMSATLAAGPPPPPPMLPPPTSPLTPKPPSAEPVRPPPPAPPSLPSTRSGPPGPRQELAHQEGEHVMEQEILFIAMAGCHQIWALFFQDTVWWGREHFSAGMCANVAGSGNEANRNNSYPRSASFAQPSGLTFCPARDELMIADSESSSIRSINLKTGKVSAVVGGSKMPDDLFCFGDIDGKGYDAKLQHPLGVAWHDQSQSLFVADSYNHKIKVVNFDNMLCSSYIGNGHSGDLLAGLNSQLNEPGGLSVSANQDKLYIADTNNHSIKVVNFSESAVSELTFENLLPSMIDSPEPINSESLSIRICYHGKIMFHIDTLFPPEIKLTEGAPQCWMLKLPDANWKSDAVGGTFNPLETLKVCVTAPPLDSSQAAESHIKLSAKLFLCADGACKAITSALTFKVTCDQDAPNTVDHKALFTLL